MQLPILIGLRPSFLQPALRGLLYALVAFSVLFIQDALTQGLAGLLGLLSLLLDQRRLRGQQELVGLWLLAEGHLKVRVQWMDEWVEAQLLPGARVQPWLTVMQVQWAGYRQFLTLTPDCLEPDDFRRLRVWLKWRADFALLTVDA